jgi:hypothetical protein
MEIHLRFKGTPTQFGTVVAVVARRWTILGRISPIRLGPIGKGEDPDFVMAFLEVNSYKVITFKPVEVIAHRLPNGESELTLVAAKEYWDSFEPTWEILYNELVKEGWVDVPQSAPAETSENSTRKQATEKRTGELEAKAESNVALSPESLKPAGRGKVKRIRKTAKNAKRKSKSEKDSTRPKRKTTAAKWRRDWKLIKPLFDEGKEINAIAGLLDMSRERVSKIIAWADPRST